MSQNDPPHRRFNALTGQWVLVSPHRTERPWQGKQEQASGDPRPAHDPNCYLCAGNTRAGGQKNPDYTNTFVFDNDYPALLSAVGGDEPQESSDDRLFQTAEVEGTCRVICFSPRHDLTLPQMSSEAIRHVIDLWSQQTEELGQRYKWVQVFENKGAVMGCSNPHPHGQIWASDQLPETPAAEEFRQAEYLRDCRQRHACRLRTARTRAQRTRGREHEALACGRSLLGDVAFRDAATSQATCPASQRSERRRA